MDNLSDYMDNVMGKVTVHDSQVLQRITLAFNNEDWLDIYYNTIRASLLIWRDKYYIDGRGVSAPTTIRFKNRKHYAI